MVPSLVYFFFFLCVQSKGKTRAGKCNETRIYILYIHIYSFQKKNGFGCVLTLQQTAAGLLASSRASQSEHSTFMSPFFPNLPPLKRERETAASHRRKLLSLVLSVSFLVFLVLSCFFFSFLALSD
uniref:Secreted protein n=1 Tax=Ixodes scapularis TaxID=6945 RepID=A0A4D5RFJ0_IXOSC